MPEPTLEQVDRRKTEAFRERHRQIAKSQWLDPVQRKKKVDGIRRSIPIISRKSKGRPKSLGMRQALSNTKKKQWADEGFKKTMIEKRKWVYKDPVYLQHLGEARKRNWANPEYREKISKAISSSMVGKLIGDKNPARKPEVRKKISDHVKESWTPEVKKKIIRGIRQHNIEARRQEQLLKEQGFKVLNLSGGGRIPDLIAAKEGKILGIEVTGHDPNYGKWSEKSIFDDIVWVVRKHGSTKK